MIAPARHLVVALAATTLLNAAAAAQTPRPFRVVSYNILVGFGDHRVGTPYRPGQERRENVLAWLKSQKPDVVSLQELNGYDEAKLRKDSARWGHPYAVMLKTSGYPTALTSKRPIVVVERRLKGLHHGMMVCRTSGIDFVVVHLWPFKGDERLREVNAALELYRKSRAQGRRVVILGDFNAVSAADVGRFSDAANERYAKWKWETKDGRPRTSVIDAVHAAGLVDIHGKHRTATDPLPLPRIDFIFASQDLAAKSIGSQWRTDPDALRDSDHPGTVADFDYRAPRFPGYPSQDALSYELELDVDPTARRLEGEVRYRIKALVATDRVFLDARRGDGWSVGFRDADGQPIPARWHEDRVVLPLSTTVAAGDEIRLSAHLRGTPPDGFYFKNSRYGEPLAFTDHYSIRARGWLPCEDHPGDRARFEVDLTYPKQHEAVISGAARTDPQSPPDGKKRVHYATRSDVPPYMFAICVGPYARVPEKGDDRLLPHYVYRKDVDKAAKQLVHHAAWMRTMESTFGKYPYGKYTTIQCPTRWGGFEAPGNVQLNESLFDGPRGVGTLAHEFVHMWFGDGVGYAQWREVWLSEGFASYFGPWLHAQTGGPPLVRKLNQHREAWRRSRDGRVKSIRWGGFAHPDEALNANTYPKGAWVLHMLRGELGDEAFFGAIKSYFEKTRGTSVLTSDFVDAIERSSGKELGWFFDQWLDRVGCPQLTVTAGADSIVVEQVQRGEPYRFNLQLAWKDQEGNPHRQRWVIDRKRKELPVPLARDLVVDPDVELLYRGR
ncbi:MAG: hypothetical protein CMJ83_16810 [Planctomycetes bacterium]|nr:hypothetical protein [Planctomycetota bacterium]